MTPPRKISYENVNHDFDTPRYFSDFPRIQIRRHQEQGADNFRALSLQDRVELMEKLIVRVKEL
jgi:hypothetical protein